MAGKLKKNDLRVMAVTILIHALTIMCEEIVLI